MTSAMVISVDSGRAILKGRIIETLSDTDFANFKELLLVEADKVKKEHN